MNIAKDAVKLLDKCAVCEVRKKGWKMNVQDCEKCPVEERFKELRELLYPKVKRG